MSSESIYNTYCFHEWDVFLMHFFIDRGIIQSKMEVGIRFVRLIWAQNMTKLLFRNEEL